MERKTSYIPRDRYIDRIRPFIGSHIIKVLTGQRRVGKSYILYQLMDEIKKGNPRGNIIYINPELGEFRNIRTDGDLYDFTLSRLQSGEGGNYVFIDEIQEIPGFETAIRALFAEERCDIYCTGSNSRLLSGELATYLGGRYIQFRIHPLGYDEFLRFHGLSNTAGALRRYLRIGGMPYLASLPPEGPGGREALADEYLKNVYESILFRDVILRENVRNLRFLENLTAYLADNTGSLFSASNISKYLKSQRIAMPVQTVINYLGALERSFFVNSVQRMDIRGLKIFEIGEKYYFEDPGLRNILARNPLPLDIAKLVEQAVYLFLVQREYTVHVGKTDGGEVDFVAERQGDRRYVQAAYRIGDAETYHREFGGLEGIRDNFPKYVVTLDEDILPVNPKGIRCILLRDFLNLPTI